MKSSQTIANLAAALVAAQADLRAVAKDSTNPHFKSKFASLDAIIDMVRPNLAKHGLAVVQGAVAPDSDAEGVTRGFTVETTLVHKSGEWLSTGAFIPLPKSDPQGAGAAMTYGRRYSLAAVLSIATDEDDDGNHAQSAHRASSTPAPAGSPTGTGNGAKVTVMPFGKTKGRPLTDHTDDQLLKTLDWCRNANSEKFAGLMEAIEGILEDRRAGLAL